MQVRLQKYLADAGIASRRVAEMLILKGKVKVNGQLINVLGVKIDPAKDQVYCYDKPVSLPDKPVYLMLNKPPNYLTTVKDPQNRKTVMSLLPKGLKVHPVGRLDMNSTGLLLFTNDGNLTEKLTHPKFRHQKEYLVKVNKPLDNKCINTLKQGVKLDEGLAKADSLNQINNYEFQIIIHQGWKRQIRRMVEAVGYQVIDLERIRIGKLILGNLQPGKYRLIDKKDII